MPPIMVAGMTLDYCILEIRFRLLSMLDITLNWLVGYRNEADMTVAINNIQASIPPGRGVTVNIILC